MWDSRHDATGTLQSTVPSSCRRYTVTCDDEAINAAVCVGSEPVIDINSQAGTALTLTILCLALPRLCRAVDVLLPSLLRALDG